MVGSNILLLMIVQKRVVILQFLQEKMSAYLSTLPSCRGFSFALERGISSMFTVTPTLHSLCSSTYHLAGASLPLDV